MAYVFYTADEDDTLSAMAKRGKSAAEIGEILGRNRCSVIGRAHRLGVKLNGKDGPKPSNVIRLPAKQEKPKLRVITNISLSVEDWLKKHGGPRRFESGFCTDYLSIKSFLARYGVDLNLDLASRKYAVQRDGRTKRIDWSAVLRTTDEFRRSEGLEPILAERASA